MLLTKALVARVWKLDGCTLQISLLEEKQVYLDYSTVYQSFSLFEIPATLKYIYTMSKIADIHRKKQYIQDMHSKKRWLWD